MSAKKPIRLFVTHNFADHADYHRVFEYLESTPNFFYVNCSAPDAAPAAGGKEAIKDEYRKQITSAEVVVVLGSLYADAREWIAYQMDVAQAFELPIVALKAFGGAVDLPDEIGRRADETVDWNGRSIVDAVRRQARHEDTTRWEVIEFDM
jgi:hypothetical protein